jgi:hypothetical protein
VLKLGAVLSKAVEQELAAASTGRAAPAVMSTWASLYRVGALAAAGVLGLIPIQMIVYLVSPPPGAVADWFALFQRSSLLGLLSMDLLLMVDYVLLGLVLLALGAALWRVSPAITVIAVSFELIAVATYFASTAALEMLVLSNAHTAATTEAERAILLAAGQAMLVNWQGTAFAASYILSGVALLMISAVMLRSPDFGKRAGQVGIVAGAAGLVPASAGTLGLVLSLASLVPLVIWLVFVARTLFRLGGGGLRPWEVTA